MIRGKLHPEPSFRNALMRGILAGGGHGDGCTPGGNCCSACSSTPRMGDVECDQDGNCYDTSTNTFTPAPPSPSISSTLSSAFSSIGTTITPTMWLTIGLSMGALYLYSSSSPAPRRRR